MFDWDFGIGMVCATILALTLMSLVSSCEKNARQHVADMAAMGVDPVRTACALGIRSSDLCGAAMAQPYTSTVCKESGFDIPAGCVFHIECAAK